MGGETAVLLVHCLAWIGMRVWLGVEAGTGPVSRAEGQRLRGGNKGHMGTPALLTTHSSNGSQRGRGLSHRLPPGTQPAQHWF